MKFSLILASLAGLMVSDALLAKRKARTLLRQCEAAPTRGTAGLTPR